MHIVLLLLAGLVATSLHRLMVSLADLHARSDAALAGSEVPPLFASPCSAHAAPALAGQGGAAWEDRS